jgi:hypothetical protein
MDLDVNDKIQDRKIGTIWKSLVEGEKTNEGD